METLCIKLDKRLVRIMQHYMEEHHYSTKTEFVRDAIRMKVDGLEKKKALQRLEKYYGASPLKTTDEDLRRVRQAMEKEWDDEQLSS
jgi:metal-responsive CopG/Arc/MetJ family transcriptional regulator